MNTPRFWTRLLKWFCNNSFFEEIQGDLEEQYNAKLKKDGKPAAKAFYRKEVIFLIRPSVIKYIPFRRLVNWAFVLHAFKASFRNLKKHRAYSLLNIVGFAAAISICLFCVNAIYSNQQLDQKFEDKEFIYRVNTERTLRGNKSIWATSQIPLYEKIQEAIPEASKIAILQNGAWGFEAFLKGSKKRFKVSSVNRDFFNVFNYQVLHGNTDAIFENKSQVVITKEVMDQYYDPNTVIGTTMGPYIIAAVIETPHKVSHLKFDILANDLKDKDASSFYSSWEVFSMQQLYIKRNPKSEISTIETKLNSIASDINSELGKKENVPTFNYQLEPLKDLASSDVYMNQGDLLTSGGQKIVLVLMSILLGICAFNYTNLAMASAITRTKEVAVRKVMGSRKSALVLQFLSETLILSLTAFGLGLMLFRFLAPKFATFSDFYFQTELGPNQLIVFFIFTVGTAIISGLIPGMIISNISVLQLFRKTKSKAKISLKHLKKSLVVIQMTISLFVFIFGFILFNQAKLINNQDNPLSRPGFAALQIPTLDSTNLVFRNELNTIKGVESVTTLERLPFIQSMPSYAFVKLHNLKHVEKGIEILNADTVILDYLAGSIKWYGKKPKDLSRPFFLGNKLFEEEVSDTAFHVSKGAYSLGNEEYYPVLGSIDNLLSSDPAIDPNPAAILVDPNTFPTSFIIELPKNNYGSVLSEVQELFNEQYPNESFQPYFLDDLLDQSLSPFRNVIRAVFFVLSSMIIITMMGQIGMSIFMAKTKEKEIGIRKVLGANFNQIVNIVLKSTYIQIIIGALIACPLAYWFYTKAVPSFTFQLEIGIEHFALGLATFSVLVIGLITFQTWGTTNAQPAETLRNE